MTVPTTIHVLIIARAISRAIAQVGGQVNTVLVPNINLGNATMNATGIPMAMPMVAQTAQATSALLVRITTPRTEDAVNDSHHAYDYNDRRFSHIKYPVRRSPSPQSRKRNNNSDRSNSPDRSCNNHHDYKDRSTSPEEAFHVDGNFAEVPFPQGNNSIGFNINKSVAVDSQTARFYEWDDRPESNNSTNRGLEANCNKN